MSGTSIGLIANPASGKDIRRLVAHGTVFDNQEKVNIVRRIILACNAAGVQRIYYMPDYYGIVHKAVDGIPSNITLQLRIEALPMQLTGTQEDSKTAAQLMAALPVGCIIALGGDGTSRQVAKECGRVPLLPISTGTNNVFPSMVEGTTAGLAASVVAGKQCGTAAVFQAKRLGIYKNGVLVDMALVDAVELDEHFIGSKAMWEVENMVQAVFTQGLPTNIGIASIVGFSLPVSPCDPGGAVVQFGTGGGSILAPIAPGLMQAVPVINVQRIGMHQRIPLKHTPCLLALDGEREVEFASGDTGHITLEPDGPLVVDVLATLAGAVEAGMFKKTGA